MKYLKLIALSVALIIVNSSCSTKTEPKEGEEEATTDEWKGMDDFHMIMAESFHPYRDSANLAPVKQYAPELVTLVDQWIAQELPDRVDNDDVKKLLSDLKVASDGLADLVEVGDDDAIGTSLTNVHDTFHHLQEAWYKKEHH